MVRRPTTHSLKYADRATRFARGVAAGKILAPDTVRQACRLHLGWLAEKKWVFDKAKANKAAYIIEHFRHVKGDWASRGECIRLEDWQVFLVCSLFGWVDGAGRRRFRQAYVKLPRKNAKSTLAAAIGLVLAFTEGEAGAEVYAGATSEKQAWEVFGPASQMARGDFAEAFDLKVAARSIFSADMSRFAPIIGKPGDGASPHGAIIDEYHEHATPEQFNTMVTGMGARSQPLALVITTAGDNTAGPCFQLEKHALSVLAGDVQDDRIFALIYGIDRGDDWRDFRVWRKANPNLGVSLDEDFLRDRYQESLVRPELQGVNLTKHLNVWVTARDAWLNRAKWDACGDAGLVDEDFAGCAATIGGDLASKIDIAALVARVVAADGRVIRFPRFYIPEAQLGPGSQNAAAYSGWVASGHLVATPGDAIDFEFIEMDLRRWMALFRVTSIGFDPWQSADISQRLLRDGAPVVDYGMNPRNLAAPMVQVEAAVEVGAFLHPANPCFDWMASNVTAREDARGNKYPRKPDGQAHLKIDGMMAALMAEGLAMAQMDDGPSVYELRGLLVI